MQQPARPMPRSISPVRIILAVLLILASTVGIAVEGRDVMRKIDAQSNSSSDNLQWTLSQVDVELLNLSISIDDTSQDPAELPALRTRFDVLYSRIKTLEAGSVFAALRKSDVFLGGFSQLQTFVADTAPVMDGPDLGLQLALPELKLRARAAARLPCDCFVRDCGFCRPV